jgi:hypothetical protein
MKSNFDEFVADTEGLVHAMDKWLRSADRLEAGGVARIGYLTRQMRALRGVVGVGCPPRIGTVINFKAEAKKRRAVGGGDVA